MTVFVSLVSYTGDGTNRDFTFTFPYIMREHVKVYLDGVATTAFVWMSDGMLRLNTAPANGVTVVIKRETPKGGPIVTIANGSNFKASDINAQSKQAMYVVQEYADSVDSTFAQTLAAAIEADEARDDAVAKAAVVLADKNTVAADKAIVAADKATVAADKATVNADKNTVAADKAIVAADKATVAADKATTITAKTDAQTARDVTLAARDATLAAFDSFDDRYLGSKASDPVVDNDGNPLVGGMLYWNSAGGGMRLYNGTIWDAAYISPSGVLMTTNNLSDLPNKPTARTNLGLGNVDNTSDANKPVSTAQQTALNLKADASAVTTSLGLKADKATTISAGGIATGGGDLSASRTITVPKASNAEAIAGTDDTKAMTPIRVKEAVIQFAPSKAEGRFVEFKVSGTYTHPAGLVKIRVIVVGGGGGGAGHGTSGTGVSGFGAGGGTAIKTILAAALGATETVTIGAGGNAGAAGNNDGGTGGTSSFGAHCSATGGAGGKTGGSGDASTSGPGGVGSGGDLNIYGGGGVITQVMQTPFGTTPPLKSAHGAGDAAPANSGAGGGGGRWASAGSVAGGAGGSGYVLIQEFFS